MPSDSTIVFCIIGVAAAAMASNRVRFDMVALLVVLALILSGVLTVGESLSGFGSSVVILVAGLLVIGEMLDRTGVARAVGDWILKRGGSNFCTHKINKVNPRVPRTPRCGMKSLSSSGKASKPSKSNRTKETTRS